MDEILNATLEEMGMASFDCSCGKHHEMNIKKTNYGKRCFTENYRNCRSVS